MNVIDAFLLGVIVAASFTAAVFFLKFWRITGDILFCAFAVFFFIEGLDRIALFFSARPNEGNPWIYLIRLVAFLLILAAILRKNFGTDR